MITPAALCLRPRRTVVSTAGFTSAQAAAITQGLSLVRSLGGVAYAPQLSLATVNSDGSGGLSALASPQALGLVSDLSNGIGAIRTNLTAPTGGSISAVGTDGFDTTVAISADEIFASVASIVVGQQLLAVCDVTITSGSVRLVAEGGSVFSPIITTSGPLSIAGAATAAPNIYFRAGATGFSGSVRNIRVFALPSAVATAATQATTANKPTLGPGALPGFGSMVLGNNTQQGLITTAPGSVEETLIYAGRVFAPPTATNGALCGRGLPGQAGFGELLHYDSDKKLGYVTGNGASYYLVSSAAPFDSGGAAAIICRKLAGSNTIQINNEALVSAPATNAASTGSMPVYLGRFGNFNANRADTYLLGHIPVAVSSAQAAIIMNCLRAFAGMPLL